MIVMPPLSYSNLTPGDPAPWFKQRSTSNPAYAFDTTAGRHIVLCFFGFAADPKAAAALSLKVGRDAASRSAWP